MKGILKLPRTIKASKHTLSFCEEVTGDINKDLTYALYDCNLNRKWKMGVYLI